MIYEKILIIGGAGFIGTNLVNSLVEKGAGIKIFTRSGRSVKNLSGVLDKIELVYGDYMDEVALRKAVRDTDCIIHLISTTFPGTSIDSGVYDIFSNLIPTIRLLEASIQNKTKKIIYASSGGTIYGEPKTYPIDEEHPLNPKSMYGLSKKTIEGYLDFFAGNFDLNVQMLRLSNPFGPYQNPYGAQGLIGVALRCALEHTPIKIFGEGETVRDYIYIDDVISAFHCALDTPKSETLNISSGTGKSVIEVLDTIESISGRKIIKEYVNQRRGDVAVNVLSNNKAREVYQWQPKSTFEEGVTSTWNWILEEFPQ